MVTRTTAKKTRKRSVVKTRVREARGMETINEKGPIIDAGPSLYLVPSVSSDSYRTVRYLGGLWSCDCPYYASGHATCRHICAVRITLVMRETAAHAIKEAYVKAPQVKCVGCGLTDFHASTTYPTDHRGDATVYLCDNPRCGYRFTWRPGFKKKWYSDDTITDALVDAAAGHPPGRILERMLKNGIKVSKRTIQRWIDEYSGIVERLASTLHHATGGRWSIDEKYLKTHPNGSRKKHWLVAVVDEETGMILGYEVTDNKSGYDATGLLERIIARTGRVPDVLVADKLSGYKKGFENSIKSRNPAAMLVADVGINGKHINNNKRERVNDELEDCLARGRGFWSRIPGRVRLTIMYHNFVHKPEGDEIPAKVAGIIVDGPDYFKTLIQNAALAVT